MKRKNSIGIIAIAVMMLFAAVPFSANYVKAETTPTIRATDVKGNPGETVNVKFYLENNPGIVALGFWFQYDPEVLTLSAFPTDGKQVFVANEEEGVSPILTMSPNKTNNPFYMLWIIASHSDVTADGLLATAKFTINENVTPGTKTEVSVIFDEENTYDVDFHYYDGDKAFAVKNATIQAGDPKPDTSSSGATTIDDVGQSATADVQGAYISTDRVDVYKVDIAWGDMQFTYKAGEKTWNVNTHSWDSADGEWIVDGSNEIVITNHSSVEVDVELSASELSDGLTGTFSKTAFTLAIPQQGVDGATKQTVTFNLSGDFADETATNYKTVGTITVTIK